MHQNFVQSSSLWGLWAKSTEISNFVHAGLWAASNYLGMFLGPSIGGIIIDKFGFQAAALCFSCLFCLTFLIDLVNNMTSAEPDLVPQFPNVARSILLAESPMTSMVTLSTTRYQGNLSEQRVKEEAKKDDEKKSLLEVPNR